MRDKNEEKLAELKATINRTINGLYEEVTEKALSMDKYRMPVHGIQHPDLENPVNLFQR